MIQKSLQLAKLTNEKKEENSKVCHALLVSQIEIYSATWVWYTVLFEFIRRRSSAS